ncbi:hypothetical protein L484_001087 [Morus notabilis]|uniref:Uncharacterized protein n=1 Tax=Morus notabilis TaxID=981085 RepID=W9RIV3_9ROSA|nr:hypothetical protein L484_001087 [Morus notabilis]
MAVHGSSPNEAQPSGDIARIWREFSWGAIAGAFGEGMMHPIDTIKTRIQSQAILTGTQV